MNSMKLDRRQFFKTMAAGAVVVSLPAVVVAADTIPEVDENRCNDECLHTWNSANCSNPDGYCSKGKEFREWAYIRTNEEFKLFYLGDSVRVHIDDLKSDYVFDLINRKRFIRVMGPSFCIEIDTLAMPISETNDAYGNLKLRFLDSTIMRSNSETENITIDFEGIIRG